MRTTTKALIVETATREDLEKIKNNKSIMEQFKCELPRKRRPVIIIYDVTTASQDEEIKKTIYDQNFDEMEEGEFNQSFNIRFRTGPKGKSTSHIVVGGT